MRRKRKHVIQILRQLCRRRQLLVPLLRMRFCQAVYDALLQRPYQVIHLHLQICRIHVGLKLYPLQVSDDVLQYGCNCAECMYLRKLGDALLLILTYLHLDLQPAPSLCRSDLSALAEGPVEADDIRRLALCEQDFAIQCSVPFVIRLLSDYPSPPRGGVEGVDRGGETVGRR